MRVVGGKFFVEGALAGKAIFVKSYSWHLRKEQPKYSSPSWSLRVQSPLYLPCALIAASMSSVLHCPVCSEFSCNHTPRPLPTFSRRGPTMLGVATAPDLIPTPTSPARANKAQRRGCSYYAIATTCEKEEGQGLPQSLQQDAAKLPPDQQAMNAAEALLRDARPFFQLPKDVLILRLQERIALEDTQMCQALSRKRT